MRNEQEIRAELATFDDPDLTGKYATGFKQALKWVLNDRVMPKGVIYWPETNDVALWNEYGEGYWSIDGSVYNYPSQAKLEESLGTNWEVLKEF